jgi:hypothetical protein
MRMRRRWLGSRPPFSIRMSFKFSADCFLNWGSKPSFENRIAVHLVRLGCLSLLYLVFKSVSVSYFAKSSEPLSFLISSESRENSI